MPKEDMIKLVEALAAVGFKIISFSWVEVSNASPHIETVELKLLKR